MDISEIPAEQVSAVIEQILKDKDPAIVGLRRILRKKPGEAQDFPLRSPVVEEFAAPGKRKGLLSADEQRIIELERKTAHQKQELDKNTERARLAVGKAYEQGYKEALAVGIKKGKAEADAEYQKMIKAVQLRVGSIIKQIENEKMGIYADAEHGMLELCNAVVRKILATEPLVNKEIILNVLRKALAYVAERQKLVIRVAPGDLETLSANKDFWTPVIGGLKEVTIETDERIEKGGCIIESNSGIVDARLGVQLGELEETIEKSWQSLNARKENTLEAGSS